MDQEKLINNLIHKTNKEITKLKYEGEFFKKNDLVNMIETFQHHIFLINTYFDKPEFTTADVKIKLLEKLHNEY